MKTKRSGVIKAIAFLANMSLIGSCTSVGDVQPQSKPDSQQNETATQQTVVNEDLIPASSMILPDDTEVPEYFIGEDGRFEFIHRESEYLSDSWYKGYAGMFTPEDIAGKSIQVYAIDLPLQIHGSWSSDSEEYLTSLIEIDGRTIPEADVYRREMHRSMTMKLFQEVGDFEQNPEWNYFKRTPYLEADQAYREMIFDDDALSVDEQLELIIKNHKGYIRNLNIDPLIPELIEPVSREEAEAVIEPYSDGRSAVTLEDITGTVRESEEPDELVTLYQYAPNILIGYEQDYVGNGVGEEFVEQVVTAFEVLKHRLPLIYDDVIAPADNRVLMVSTNSNGTRWGAVSDEVSWDDGGHHLTLVYFYPATLEAIHEYYVDGAQTYEGFISTFLHESIHNSIRSGQMNEFPYATDHFHEMIDEYDRWMARSELLTYTSDAFLREIINFSHEGYRQNDLFVWRGYLNNTNAWDDVNYLDYFVRIIDNRLGQE